MQKETIVPSPRSIRRPLPSNFSGMIAAPVVREKNINKTAINKCLGLTTTAKKLEFTFHTYLSYIMY